MVCPPMSLKSRWTPSADERIERTVPPRDNVGPGIPSKGTTDFRASEYAMTKRELVEWTFPGLPGKAKAARAIPTPSHGQHTLETPCPRGSSSAVEDCGS